MNNYETLMAEDESQETEVNYGHDPVADEMSQESSMDTEYEAEAETVAETVVGTVADTIVATTANMIADDVIEDAVDNVGENLNVGEAPVAQEAAPQATTQATTEAKVETYHDLIAQATALMEKAKEAKKQQLASVIADIKAKIADFGISAEDLGFAPVVAVAKEKAKKAKAEPKYRGPQGQLWAGGVGPRPQWVKDLQEQGANLEDYRIAA